jgi:hypothetical protein
MKLNLSGGSTGEAPLPRLLTMPLRADTVG